MKKLFTVLLFTAMSSFGFFANAEEHSLGTIKGSHNIDLKEYDHSFSGSILDFVVFGNVDEATNSAELIMKKDGQLIKTVFQKTGTEFGGTVHHEIDGKVFDTKIIFKGLDAARNKFMYEVNGKSLEVTVLADAFENNHYINPQYIVTYGSDLILYKLSGQACYRYSAFLNFLILGAVLH
jgi:hypothetical protein